jgi:hypothetical protein
MHKASFQKVVCLNLRMVLNHLYNSEYTVSCIKTKEQVIAHIREIQAYTNFSLSLDKLKKLDNCHT